MHLSRNYHIPTIHINTTMITYDKMTAVICQVEMQHKTRQ